MTHLLSNPPALIPSLATVSGPASTGPSIAGIPIEFVLFALTLPGVALVPPRVFTVALVGMSSVALYKIVFTGFKTGVGVMGFVGHLGHEWVTLGNLFCLLLGFAILARHFEESRVPETLPRFLPNDWKGAFLMLCMVWVLSSFLDNIAAAMIGGAMAHKLFNGKVHIGYLAAIVAASNAGGAFSVVGDTTTTMMWIGGASPGMVFEAIIASVVALLISGYVGARQQHAYCPIAADSPEDVVIDWGRLLVVGSILVFAVATHSAINSFIPERAWLFPFIGVEVAVSIPRTSPVHLQHMEVVGAPPT